VVAMEERLSDLRDSTQLEEASQRVASAATFQSIAALTQVQAFSRLLKPVNGCGKVLTCPHCLSGTPLMDNLCSGHSSHLASVSAGFPCLLLLYLQFIP
jgi:hypothetical protein